MTARTGFGYQLSVIGKGRGVGSAVRSRLSEKRKYVGNLH